MFLTKAEAQDAERTFLMNYEKQKDLDFESLALIYLKEYKKRIKRKPMKIQKIELLNISCQYLKKQW